jgi:CRISPR-associated protein Cmr2
MQTAQQTLLEEWLRIGDLVFKELKDKRDWLRQLKADHKRDNPSFKLV